jgi:uncharacterized protein DUF6286
MTRLPRRTVPALIVALLLLVASVLVGVSCVQTIAGVPPLLAFDTLGRTAASFTLADPPVLAAGGLLALLGTVLLLCALLPGTPQVLPLAAHEGGAVAGVARNGLARDLVAHARRVDGITAVRVNVGARTIRATAGTPLRDHSGLADNVRAAIGTRLAEIELARVPRIRVQVVPDRSTR